MIIEGYASEERIQALPPCDISIEMVQGTLWWFGTWRWAAVPRAIIVLRVDTVALVVLVSVHRQTMQRITSCTSCVRVRFATDISSSFLVVSDPWSCRPYVNVAGETTSKEKYGTHKPQYASR